MPVQGQGMPMQFFAFGPIMFIVMAIVIVIPFWMILRKTGQSKRLSLLMVIPPVNTITLCRRAFFTWPGKRGQG